MAIDLGKMTVNIDTKVSPKLLQLVDLMKQSVVIQNQITELIDSLEPQDLIDPKINGVSISEIN